MELIVNIDYAQILQLVKQLTFDDKQRLTTVIAQELHSAKNDQPVADEESNEFQNLLLQGPVMSDEQFNHFKELRENFNTWLRN